MNIRAPESLDSSQPVEGRISSQPAEVQSRASRLLHHPLVIIAIIEVVLLASTAIFVLIRK